MLEKNNTNLSSDNIISFTKEAKANLRYQCHDMYYMNAPDAYLLFYYCAQGYHDDYRALPMQMR